MAKDPRLVTRADHERIQSKISLAPNEDYAVTVQKGKGFWVKTTHVFERRPSQGEINAYEQTASRLKWRGNKAEMEGSQINAAVELYNKVISRAFDVLVGMKVVDKLDRERAREKVDPLVKREAIRELIGEVYSASRMEENLGGGPEDEDDTDPEAHTSDESEDSGQP
jgi:hypothetical protein